MEREGLDRLSREELLELLLRQVEVVGRQQEELAERGAAIEHRDEKIRALEEERFSVPQATWLLLSDPEASDPEERAYIGALGQRCPEAEHARELARRFLTLVRKRDHATLTPWVELAEASYVPELRSFATGLRRDWAAVSAGLELSWSNGQTEGQVNRLKLLKRQMYGRATFAFLRRRFLLAS
jgi:transposase